MLLDGCFVHSDADWPILLMIRCHLGWHGCHQSQLILMEHLLCARCLLLYKPSLFVSKITLWDSIAVVISVVILLTEKDVEAMYDPTCPENALLYFEAFNWVFGGSVRPCPKSRLLIPWGWSRQPGGGRQDCWVGRHHPHDGHTEDQILGLASCRPAACPWG